jgi:hypothetical protein
MTKKILVNGMSLLLALLLLNFLFTNGPACFAACNAVINDFNFYPVPDIPRPAKGQTILDPIFHMPVTRITDAPADVPGPHYNYAFPGYPKHNIENADGSMLIVQSLSGSAWHIWNAYPPYNKIKDISPSLIGWGTPIDARWDNDDPNILYFYREAKFYKYNVSTDTVTLLRDFQQDFPNEPVALATMMEEGDASDDRRYWAFIIRCYDANHNPTWYNTAYVVFDKDYFGKDNGKIISELDDTDVNFRGAGFISMSPSGKYVWIGDTHFIYPRDFSSVRQLECSGHADMAISAEGREVIVCGRTHYINYLDSGVWTMMVDIETGEQTWLAPTASGEYHISGNAHDKPGWALVSVYGPTYPAEPTTWSERSAYMVELTKRVNPAPRVWRLAHTHTARKSYADDSFAKLNRKGTKVFFGSGWGNSSQDGQYDVYQIDIPQACYDYLAGNVNGNDTEVPLVAMTHSPQSPSVTQPITFTAEATDNVGLKEIQVYVDGTLLKTCTSSPCEVTIGPYPPGAHTYHAIAVDLAGNQNVSETASVAVVGEQPPPPENESISNVQVSPGDTTATITWETLCGTQSMLLTSLEPGKTYGFAITSAGGNGNAGSYSGTFATSFTPQLPSLSIQDEANGTIVVSSSQFKVLFQRTTYAGIKEWYNLQNDPSSDENLASSYSGLTGRNVGSNVTAEIIESSPTRAGIRFSFDIGKFHRTITYFIYPTGSLYVKRTDLASTGTSAEQIACISLALNAEDWKWLSDKGGYSFANADYWIAASKPGKGSVIDIVYSADPLFRYSYAFGGNTGKYGAGSLALMNYYGPIPAQASGTIIHKVKLQPDGLDTEVENDMYSQEYRTPAALMLSKGNGGLYNPAEGSYEIASQDGGTRFTLDPGTHVRTNPVLKISGWTNPVPSGIVVSGQTRMAGIDYNASKVGSSTLILQYFGEVTSPTVFEINGQ